MTDVAPLAGAWIETGTATTMTAFVMSRPSRARGLKPLSRRKYCGHMIVAPLAGAWIETGNAWMNQNGDLVAPLAGAWIETSLNIDEYD